METTPLLFDEEEGKDDDHHEDDYDNDHFEYYGRNDLRPIKPLSKRICLYITLIILSPILLPLFILYVIFVFVLLKIIPFTDNQWKASKLMAYEGWWKVPGKPLEVIVSSANFSSSRTVYDIIIPHDFVSADDETKLNSSKYISLRKSIEYTVQNHLRQCNHLGSKIFEMDQDRDEPHYLLHGWTGQYDPNADELWCTHASTATWAAIYSWVGHLQHPGGWWFKYWDQTIDLTTAPKVLGYIYLFEITNPDFYAQEEESQQQRVIHVGGNTINAPDHTPQTDGKIFARYGYGQVQYMGDFPPGDPDAYIFKGQKVLNDAKLKILHQYRVLKPGG